MELKEGMVFTIADPGKYLYFKIIAFKEDRTLYNYCDALGKEFLGEMRKECLTKGLEKMVDDGHYKLLGFSKVVLSNNINIELKCTCDLPTLMRSGCICGCFKKEQASKKAS